MTIDNLKDFLTGAVLIVMAALFLMMCSIMDAKAQVVEKIKVSASVNQVDNYLVNCTDKLSQGCLMAIHDIIDNDGIVLNDDLSEK